MTTKLHLAAQEKAPMNVIYYFPDLSVNDAPTLILDADPELEATGSIPTPTSNFAQVINAIQPEEKSLATDKSSD